MGHTRTRPLRSLEPQFDNPAPTEYESFMASTFFDAPLITDMLRFREELRRQDAKKAARRSRKEKADLYEPLSWQKRKF